MIEIFSRPYLFENLTPGTYYVVFDLPADYNFSPKDNIGDDVNDSDADVATGQTACTTLSAGEDERDIDAGIYQDKAKLGDFVFEDTDKDGQQDSGEPGVQNVRVVLYNCAGDSLKQTYTGANGEYCFPNLIPGGYYVTFKDLPTGYGFSPKDQGNDITDSDADQNGQSTCTILTPNENDTTVDAGIIPPVGELGDYVWEDIDEDGEQDPNEPGVPNIRVVLYNCNGDSLAQTFTDAAGFYLFTNLPGGDYYIIFNDIPADYEFTSANQGTDDALDSDADQLTGQTPCVNLPPGGVNRTPDAGITPKRNKVCEAWEFAPNGFAMIFTSGAYYEVDSLHSRLIGKAGLAGDTLCLIHAPVNRYYGFQIGDGANDKNANYGLGGWFNFVNKSNGNSGTGDFNNSLINCVIPVTPQIIPQLGAMALLEGAYDASTGLMRTDLQAQSILPANQPFNTAPWNYNGTETMPATAPDTVTDWSLIELRDPNNPNIILARKAGLMLRGGQVVGPDGHSLLKMPQGINSAYLVIHNWNHLPVMSATPIQRYRNVFYHDFIQSINGIYTDPLIPNPPAQPITGGILLLHEGDATGDYQVNSLDLGQIMLNYFGSGSSITDVNLDGVINSLDVARTMQNYFQQSHIPR